MDKLAQARVLLQTPEAPIISPVRPFMASVLFAASGLVLVLAMILGPGFDRTAPDKPKLEPMITAHTEADKVSEAVVLKDEEGQSLRPAQ